VFAFHPFSVHAFAILVASALAACDDRSTAECVHDSECPARSACIAGLCAPRIADSGSADRSADSAPAPDWRRPLWDAGVGEAGPACTGDGDGQIDFSELRFTVPASAATATATDVTVDLAGKLEGGVRQWDLSAIPTSGSGTIDVGPLPAWAASKAPAATYASELTADYGTFTKTSLLGAFRVSSAALQLVALISEAPDHTLVTYDEPLDMLRFPLRTGLSFTTEALGTGSSDSIPWGYPESYTVEVLQRGRVRIHPKLALDALLLRVGHTVYNTPLLDPFKLFPLRRDTAFLFVVECYGTVAKLIAASDPGDQLSATQASDFWRLATP